MVYGTWQINTRILHSGPRAQDKGSPEIMCFSRILLFMSCLGPLQKGSGLYRRGPTNEQDSGAMFLV